jgi:hypothetical protein
MSEYKENGPQNELGPLEKEVVEAKRLLEIIETKLKSLPEGSPQKEAVKAEFEKKKESFLSLSMLLRDMDIYRKESSEEANNS